MFIYASIKSALSLLGMISIISTGKPIYTKSDSSGVLHAANTRVFKEQRTNVQLNSKEAIFFIRFPPKIFLDKFIICYYQLKVNPWGKDLGFSLKRKMTNAFANFKLRSAPDGCILTQRGVPQSSRRRKTLCATTLPANPCPWSSATWTPMNP